MNSVEPTVIDWWIAYARVEPFGQHWNRSAGIAQQISLLRYESLQSAGRDAKHLDSDTKFESHMPGDWSHAKTRKKYLTTAQEIERAKAMANFYG